MPNYDFFTNFKFFAKNKNPAQNLGARIFS